MQGTGYPRVSQDEQGIIHVVLGRGDAGVNDLRKALALHRSFSTDKSPVTVSSDASNAISMGWDALEFSRSEAVCEVTLCSALIVRSAIQEHLARLFLWYHRPPYPTRVFSSVEEARPWLLEMKQQYESSV